MTFTFGTSGRVPGTGKVIIDMPFGYYMRAPELIAYNGFGRSGTPTLSASGRTLTIQLGNGRFTDTNLTLNGSASTWLDRTDGVSVTIAGIVNPGAGSTGAYVIRTTFASANQVIDQVVVPGLGVATGMFPTRSVAISEKRAGQPTLVEVRVSTTGYVPADALLQVAFPKGLGLGLPAPTQVINSTCCEQGTCTSPCNITVHALSADEVVVRLPGSGARNLAEGSSISVTLNNVRNLWAGNKEGFDLALLLSDGVSAVLQAKDVDGPQLLPGLLRSAEAAFSETPTVADSFLSAPKAGELASSTCPQRRPHRRTQPCLMKPSLSL